MSHSLDEITAEPAMIGAAGRAWLLPKPTKPSGWAMVSVWLVEAPHAHPLWHSYLITIVHLRPEPGELDASIYLPGATHEMSVLALHPDMPRKPLLHGGPADYLTPVNFAAQIIAADDAAATQRVEKAVRAICDGTLSPDTDYGHVWCQMFGDNMLKRN